MSGPAFVFTVPIPESDYDSRAISCPECGIEWGWMKGSSENGLEYLRSLANGHNVKVHWSES